MSKQNRKKRARKRMEYTGEKYTTAHRVIQDREETPAFPGEPDFLTGIARDACNECGGGVLWITPREFERRKPEAFRELVQAVGRAQVELGRSWICDTCDNGGFFLGEPDGGGGDLPEGLLEGAEGLHEHSDAVCENCGLGVVWIDPAQGSHLDRVGYLRAKRLWGIDALLAGAAAHCAKCNSIEFHPNASVLGA